MADYKYPKEEKLKHKKEIDFLFSKGRWKTSGNLRIIFADAKDFSPETRQEKPKVGVSVSKRYFKKAVDRNQIKRQLREVYRLNKEIFAEAFGAQSFGMIFWVSNKKPKDIWIIQQEFLNICKPKEKVQD